MDELRFEHQFKTTLYTSALCITFKNRFKLEVMRKYVGSLGLQELHNQVPYNFPGFICLPL